MKTILNTGVVAFLVGVALFGCGKSDSKGEAVKPAEKVAEGKKDAKKGADAKGAKSDSEKKPEGEAHGEEQVVKLTPEEVKAAGIGTVKVKIQPVKTGMSVTASIQPNRDRFARVAPRVPGRVTTVPATLGQRVVAGQVLATLDSVEVGESTSSYQQAASQFSVAKADFERAQRLYDEQVVPQKDYLRARGEFEKARAALSAAADKLRMMGVNPAAARSSATFPVTSPFGGTVIEKTAVIGELAQPDKALFTVADLSTVWIEANLYEQDRARVKTGTDAEVTVTAYPDERFKGKLAYVSGVVDRESRTVKGRIEVPNKDGRLKLEMFATALIQTEEAVAALAVPSGAVVLLEGKNIVFVKEADGFEPRQVELGERVGDLQIITQGINEGDDVVVSGTYALKSRLLKSKLGEGHGH
jgi:cobalt-zinc-cadmium efflux system membrane fusion protein